MNEYRMHERTCAKGDMIPGDCDCQSGRFWFSLAEGSERERQPVYKASGDYRMPGVVDTIFRTVAGKVRIVVESTSEDTLGMCHIFSPEQLEPLEQA